MIQIECCMPRLSKGVCLEHCILWMMGECSVRFQHQHSELMHLFTLFMLKVLSRTFYEPTFNLNF